MSDCSIALDCMLRWSGGERETDVPTTMRPKCFMCVTHWEFLFFLQTTEESKRDFSMGKCTGIQCQIAVGACCLNCSFFSEINKFFFSFYKRWLALPNVLLFCDLRVTMSSVCWSFFRRAGVIKYLLIHRRKTATLKWCRTTKTCFWMLALILFFREETRFFQGELNACYFINEREPRA